MKPLFQLTHSAHEMARGNFTESIHIHRNDEIGILAGAMNMMATNLGNIIQKNIAVSEALSGATVITSYSIHYTKLYEVLCLQAIPAISAESPEKTMIFFYSSETGINIV